MVIKNLENKIKLVMIICALFLAGCIVISLSSIWTARSMVVDAQQKIYVLDGNVPILVQRTTMEETLDVEAKSHVEMFHHYFFTLAPEDKYIKACRKFSGATAGIPTPGFIGERESLPQTPPFLPTLLSQGWTWHSPSCYWLGEDQVTYSEARRLCTDHGSQLVTITNRYGRGTSPPLCPGRMQSLRQKGQQPAVKGRGT